MKETKFIEKFDKTKICEIYNSWSEIAQNTFESDLKPIKIDKIDHIVFCGMGGSGALGDIFSAILRLKTHQSRYAQSIDGLCCR